MNKTKISAKIVADSISPQGDRLISVLCTFPRIILAEVNTHRMLSKNTSSSRAIPFKKMVESVQNNPFIPIAWQKEHIGMQGYEYFTTEQANEIYNTDEWVDGHLAKEAHVRNWLHARDKAIDMAVILNEGKVTKQLCNRLLEPFMWTTMLITGSREGWDNFFELRCGNYDGFKSRKEAAKEFLEKGNINTSTWSDMDWRKLNKGQAEIHMMALAEEIYDAVNESTPIQLKTGEWHVPFAIEIINLYIKNKGYVPETEIPIDEFIKISTAMAAHTSYTTVGNEPVKSYDKWIELHDKLISYDPPHSSPMEHCAKAMSNAEYESFYKGQIGLGGESGWCNNFKGFIPYRYFIDNNLTF